MPLFDLVRFYSAYGSYHHNTINKLVHIVGVPSIVWSFQLFFTLAPFPQAMASLLPSTPSHPALTITWGLPVTLATTALPLEEAVGRMATRGHR